jgi:hypothetical protein
MELCMSDLAAIHCLKNGDIGGLEALIVRYQVIKIFRISSGIGQSQHCSPRETYQLYFLHTKTGLEVLHERVRIDLHLGNRKQFIAKALYGFPHAALIPIDHDKVMLEFLGRTR